MCVGKSSVMALVYSVSLSPDSDSNTVSVSDPKTVTMNDIWLVDEVLTDCSG